MGLMHAKCLVMAVLAVATIGSGAVLLNQPTVSATPSTTARAPAEPTIEELKRENQQLRQEIARLNKRLAVLEGTPPTDQEVIRAMRKGETRQGEISELMIVKEKVRDQFGPMKVYPLFGRAQLRSEHWQCTIYYRESDERDAKKSDGKNPQHVQVIYIDQNTLLTSEDMPK